MKPRCLLVNTEALVDAGLEHVPSHLALLPYGLYAYGSDQRLGGRLRSI